MTDRYAAFIVTTDINIRDDDAEAILTALRMVRHVADVKPVVADHDLYEQVRRQHARYEVRSLLIELLDKLDEEEER